MSTYRILQLNVISVIKSASVVSKMESKSPQVSTISPEDFFIILSENVAAGSYRDILARCEITTVLLMLFLGKTSPIAKSFEPTIERLGIANASPESCSGF